MEDMHGFEQRGVERLHLGRRWIADGRICGASDRRENDRAQQRHELECHGIDLHDETRVGSCLAYPLSYATLPRASGWSGEGRVPLREHLNGAVQGRGVLRHGWDLPGGLRRRVVMLVRTASSCRS